MKQKINWLRGGRGSKVEKFAKKSMRKKQISLLTNLYYQTAPGRCQNVTQIEERCEVYVKWTPPHNLQEKEIEPFWAKSTKRCEKSVFTGDH